MAADTTNLSVDIPTIISPADDPVNDHTENTAIVIDNGTCTIRAGFAGDSDPIVAFPTITASLSTVERDMVQSGYFRQFKLDKEFPDALLSIIDAYNPKSKWIGKDALNYKNKHYPIEHQLVTNWDDIVSISLSNVYINTQTHAVYYIHRKTFGSILAETN